MGSAEVRAAGSLINVNSVSGAIGPNKFSGWASVDVANKPLVKVDLDFQSIDIGAVRPVGAGSAAGGAPANIDQPWSSAPINLDGLNYFDAEVQISAAALNVETFHFAPISISAHAQQRHRARGISVRSASTAARRAAELPPTCPARSKLFAMRFDITGVRALPMLTDVAEFHLAGWQHAGETSTCTRRDRANARSCRRSKARSISCSRTAKFAPSTSRR